MDAQSAFSQHLRLRACGVLVEDRQVLLVRIHSPVTQKKVWMPPGGGVEFGESLSQCLKREFAEETGLSVSVHQLVHLHELIQDPFHAVECYFEVSRIDHTAPATGSDPELETEEQLIEEVAWMPVDELDSISFAPSDLKPKLKQWEDGSHFKIFAD